MSETVTYIGKDLEAMSFAENYHRWILKQFSPYLGQHLVEVGAGTGSFSRLLWDTAPQSLALIDPSGMYEALSANVNYVPATTKTYIYQAIFPQVAAKIKQQQQPDSIIYVNVLEHIDNEVAELAAVNETLGTGGRLFIFVPALTWLYSNFDRQLGHFRRYKKKDLVDKVRNAGFDIITCEYFDVAGILPWWIKYRLFKSERLETEAIKLYDRLIVPISRVIESGFTPPIGKNLLLIAAKR